MTTEERLEGVERSLRRARGFNVFTLVVLGLVVAAGVFVEVRRSGTLQADVVRVKQLVVDDEMGKVRADLSIIEDGPMLRLRDPNQGVRAILGVGRVVSVSYGDGEGRAAPDFQEDGPTLALADANGKMRVILRIAKDGPVLDLQDESERPRASLGTNRGTKPDGTIVAYPESTLLLVDPNGSVIWSAPRR
jgi:hypothetical protein